MYVGLRKKTQGDQRVSLEQRAGIYAGLFCSVLIFGTAAMAQEANTAMPEKASHPVKAKKHKKAAHVRITPAPATAPAGMSAADAAIATAMAASPGRFDAVYNYKGWSIPFPSFGDSLLQDYGGWRSALAANGFGFLAFTLDEFGDNVLNTPRTVPAAANFGARAPFPVCTNTANLTGAVCANNQTYFGQRPSAFTANYAFLTYDLSRWGIPDGQFAVGGVFLKTTLQAYQPGNTQFSSLSYYQTLFDKKVEVKIGFFANSSEWVGLFVGGNFANTLGVSASIPVELGLSFGPVNNPTARTTWHITDAVYNEFGVMRSTPMNSTVGNPIIAEAQADPAGVRFSVPGAGVLVMDELGYKNAAAPGVPQDWIRFGAMYNSSAFKDYTQLFSTTATVQGNSGMYFLADRQLWQQAPGSIFTAYRGIYAGVSAMYAPPNETAISQYYEGRAYWIGPLDSRPTDMATFVYSHNVVSHYLADELNAATATFANLGYGVPLARHATNSYTISYLTHIMPGVYLNLGFGYTDHPSVEYFKGEGSSLNFLASLTTVF